jgi:hypothetical protein
VLKKKLPSKKKKVKKGQFPKHGETLNLKYVGCTGSEGKLGKDKEYVGGNLKVINNNNNNDQINDNHIDPNINNTSSNLKLDIDKDKSNNVILKEHPNEFEPNEIDNTNTKLESNESKSKTNKKYTKILI